MTPARLAARALREAARPVGLVPREPLRTCSFRTTTTQAAPETQDSFNSVPSLTESSARLPLGMRPSFPANISQETASALESMPLPRNLLALYLRPLRHAPPYGIPTCNLQLRSYSVRSLEFFSDFAMRAAYYLGLAARGPVPLPRITERWTVPRSPFIFKKSQETFERVTVRRLIQIQDADAEVVSAWLAYLEKRAYHGIGMKAQVWQNEDVDVLARMDVAGGMSSTFDITEAKKLLAGRARSQPRARPRPGDALKAQHQTELQQPQPADQVALTGAVERLLAQVPPVL